MAGDDACTTATRELDQTPTWAVAGVCAAMILISIILEKSLHRVGMWLLRKQKNALFEAIEKVKSELMILGFISLLLTFFQKYIIKICVSTKVGKTMLPCRYEEQHRRLLLLERRFLADAGVVKCTAGYEPIISSNGLHDLHILLFFLAVFHVINSVITMTLGRLKIRRWKEWELETSSPDYEFSIDTARIRLTHETSFVRAHTSLWTRIPFFFYIGCFFRQFFRSVSKADYLTLRNGFISVHLAPGSKFNFQKYIKRSLEDDFKVVVGVSSVLWASFLVFLLVDVHGWQALFWASLVPLLIILAVGTKLQAILTMMAFEISEKHSVVQGIPLVQGSDKYFWFSRPRLLLNLIHFTLFQNAFQITYFLWIWYTFGLRSCFHHNFKLVLIKDILGVGVLFLCSYITLPLYALVTQMGSTYKKSIFDEETKQAIKKWHLNAKRHGGGRAGRTPTSTPGVSPSPSMPRSSPSMAHQASAAALHRFKTTGHSGRRPVSRGDHELDGFGDFGHDDGDDDREEGELRDAESQEAAGREDEFSFVKPAGARGP